MVRLLPDGEFQTPVGDFEELYNEITRQDGKGRADIWFWGQVIRLCPEKLKYSIFWRVAMFKNMIKIALRNMSKNKGYSIINISGLALGIACCIFIFLWIQNEMSYDRFHTQADSVYRVEFDQNYSGRLFHVGVSQWPLGPELKDNLAEVEMASRYSHVGDALVSLEDKSFYDSDIKAVDPDFLRMFSFSLIDGTQDILDSKIDAVILTQTTAEKLFGSKNPLGQSLTINKKYEMTVVGVMKDIPRNSSLNFSMLVPVELLRKAGYDMTNWNNHSVPLYVKLRAGADPVQTAAGIKDLISLHRDTTPLTYTLLPLSRMRLFSHYGFSAAGGAVQMIRIFSLVAVFVLLIACINFMNLSTARASTRALEVGLRKVVGARRIQIVRQFYGESVIFTLVGLALAVCLSWLCLPLFNSLMGTNLALEPGKNWMFYIGLLLIAVFTGLVSGSYPALVLSSFQPVKVIKDRMKSGGKGAAFRKILVVFQFSLSVTLLICTGIVFSQLRFMQSKNPGFAREQVIYSPLRSTVSSRYAALKETWLGLSPVLGVTGANSLPSAIYSNADGAEWEGKDPDLNLSCNMTYVGYDYFDTLGMRMVEGRPFSPEMVSDAERGFIINEELRRIIGEDFIIGMPFTFGSREGTIVGVVNNFHFDSLREKIEPLVIMSGEKYLRNMMIRLRPGNMPGSIRMLEETWSRIVPDEPFEYRFFDQDFEQVYRSEKRMMNILGAFAFLAVFIAGLGLFGLASFLADRRRKEIGVRKVLGSSVRQIVFLLSRNFLKWVFVANLIACPLAWIVGRTWLRGFAYRAPIKPELFAAACLFSLVIAAAAISYRSIRAALTDPARSIRHE